MSSMSIALIIFACIFGGALCGMVVSMLLPGHHLSKESQDTVKLGAGLVATMAALVLGLLVGSSKSAFDTIDAGITEVGAKTILLDRILAHYGPETMEIRAMVRGNVESALHNLWPEEMSKQAKPDTIEKGIGLETIQRKIRELTPTSDNQRLLQTQALQVSSDLAQLRWMLFEKRQKPLPKTLLVVLGFWLAMLYTSYGLFAPRNGTVITVLFVSALSVSGAIFLILEMSGPLDGMIKVSSAPFHKALNSLGR